MEAQIVETIMMWVGAAYLICVAVALVILVFGMVIGAIAESVENLGKQW